MPAPDVAPDAPPTRCMRDLDCTGASFCSPAGLCTPLVCTPGRVMCVSPARAQVCDGRGATFAEMDCPGGCVLNDCMGSTNPCAAPRVTCGAACVDVQTTAAHCGRCGNACAAGQSCTAGACVTPCAAPRITCGAQCVDAQTSAAHCGRCDNACAAGQTCVAGVCTTPCAAPRLVCAGACTDVQTSAAHCGRCGNACAAGQTCAAGSCVTPCAAPRLTCAGACTDVQTSTAHCGRCGNACAAGQGCVAGACTAPASGTFRVVSLSTTGCATVEHDLETGDDRGGIAVTPDAVFYNADRVLARWSHDLAGFLPRTGPRDGMVGDLATGTLYAVLNATGEQFAGSSAGMVTPFVITQLGVLDPSTAALTTARVPLSAPVTITHDMGFFAGPGFLLVFSGVVQPTVPQRWYRIDLPGGAVTAYPAPGGFAHHVCENGAWWGIAERVGTEYFAVYVRNNTSIGRLRLSDATQTVLGTFTDLADTCSITALPARNRWYFHNEGASEIAPAGVETTGWCPAVFSTTP